VPAAIFWIVGKKVLPVSTTAVAAATTARSTTTAAVEASASTATESASTYTAAANASACEAATNCTTAISVTGPSIAITRTSVAVSAAIAITAISITTAEPGTSANEQATAKPGGAVVSIRSTGIRRVAVITPLTDRGWIAIAVAPIHWTANPNTNRYLGVRISCSGNQQNTE
jgi:hypothetical protein